LLVFSPYRDKRICRWLFVRFRAPLHCRNIYHSMMVNRDDEDQSVKLVRLALIRSGSRYIKGDETLLGLAKCRAM
jgi:hypothetical protein